MEGYAIDNCLDSMVVLVDTREQPSEKAEKRIKSIGIRTERKKLEYGDYAYSFTLPDGSSVNKDGTIEPDVVIERKMSLDELAMCFCRERKRFKNEMNRAKEKNAKVYLLVEDATWENLITGKYRSNMNPKSFYSSLIAWCCRFNMTPIFCKSETSGFLIGQILYRELKERLERGLYG